MKRYKGRGRALVTALAVPAFLDVLLTLIGQPDCYWDAFLAGDNHADCPASETAWFGLGEIILDIHPDLFVLFFLLMFGALVYAMLNIKSKKITLFLYWLPFALHSKESFSWLENYIDSGFLFMSNAEFQWVLQAIFYALMLIIGLWGQRVYLRDRSRAG